MSASEIERRLAALEIEMPKLKASCEPLIDAMREIIRWCNAYPLEIFPEPDLKKARRLLEDGGITLDAVSASNMRHVLEGVRKIAQEALGKRMEKM